MDKAAAEKVIVPATRKDFAANSLVLIVPADSRFAPSSLNELASSNVKRIAYGDPASVPVGRYTQGALQAAGVWTPSAPKPCWRRTCVKVSTTCRAAKWTPVSCSAPTPRSCRAR